MANIQDYLNWRGDLKISEAPFNRIDALILCQITYLKFDGLFPKEGFKSRMTLEELGKKFASAPDYKERADTGLLINSKTPEFFISVSKTDRFKDFEITGYRSIIDLSKEEQFAAATYILPDGSNFICYRGTDDTIVGWKEDFNLALFEIPAQLDAVEYLKEAAQCLHGALRVGGHSKGGNLAIYASFNVSKSLQNRIVRIYNNDGPGFSLEKIRSKEYRNIMDRINSYYPQYSIVGMLFNNEGKYRVVESDETGLMQHDPFSWHIMGKNFVEVKKISETSKFFHQTFNSWAAGLEEERCKKFVDTLFYVIAATDAKTNSEIQANLVKNSVKILKRLNELDPELRSMMNQVVMELFKTGIKKFPGVDVMIKSRIEELKKASKKISSKVKKA